MAPWLTDWRGKYHGRAAAMLSPATTGEVAAVVRLCAQEDAALVPQGGNSGMVGGATPDSSGTQLLLSLRRMNRLDRQSVVEGQSGAGRVDTGGRRKIKKKKKHEKE